MPGHVPDRPASPAPHTIQIPIPKGRQFRNPSFKLLTIHLTDLELPFDAHTFIQRFTELVSARITHPLPRDLHSVHDKESYLLHVRTILPSLVGDEVNEEWLRRERLDANLEVLQVYVYRLMTCAFRLYLKLSKQDRRRSAEQIEMLASSGQRRTRMDAALDVMRVRGDRDDQSGKAGASDEALRDMQERLSRLELQKAVAQPDQAQINTDVLERLQVLEVHSTTFTNTTALNTRAIATLEKKSADQPDQARINAQLQERLQILETHSTDINKTVSLNTAAISNMEQRNVEQTEQYCKDRARTKETMELLKAKTDSHSNQLIHHANLIAQNTTDVSSAVAALQSHIVSSKLPKGLAIFLRVLPLHHSIENCYVITQYGLAMGPMYTLPLPPSTIYNGEASEVSVDIGDRLGISQHLFDPCSKIMILLSGYSGTGKSSLMTEIASSLLTSVDGLRIAAANQVSGSTTVNLLSQVERVGSEIATLHQLNALRATAATPANDSSSRASMVLKLALHGEVFLVDLCGDEHADQRMLAIKDQDANLRKTTGHIINNNLEVRAWVESFIRTGQMKQTGSKIIGLLGKRNLDMVCVVGCVNGEDRKGMAATLGWLKRLCG